MKKFRNLFLSSLISAFLLATNSQIAFSQSNENSEKNISEYILEPMPKWFPEGYTRGHLNISKMMKEGFSRYEAIEIQNQMKDILDSDTEYIKLEKEGKTYNMIMEKDQKIVNALEKAIKNVKENKIFESGFKPETLKDNEFYVAFDLDETLLVQWYKSGEKGGKYYSAKVKDLDNFFGSKQPSADMPKSLLLSPDYFSLTPGTEKAIIEISKIPGNKGVIFFSAKLDVATMDVVDKIKIDGKPANKFLKGVFTRNYLIRDKEPTKLSKDLRMIDESLKHIILIDDNPTRILESQKKNLREFPKYNPDEYLHAKLESKNKVVINYFEKLLPVVVDEIKEAEEYSKKNKVSFVEAFYPYSADAQTEILMLQKQGMSLKEAVDFIRKNREMLEPKFHFFEDKK